jgi:hypothetical protein
MVVVLPFEISRPTVQKRRGSTRRWQLDGLGKPTLQCRNVPPVPFNEVTMHPTLLIFAIVAFIGIATPGPTVLLALTNGSRYGVRASVDGMIGAVLSDFVLVSAVALGLGALLAASEFWSRRSSG